MIDSPCLAVINASLSMIAEVVLHGQDSASKRVCGPHTGQCCDPATNYAGVTTFRSLFHAIIFL